MSRKIVLIVGASGVGKDSLLKKAKKQIEANFVKRYITREPDDNELNFFLEKEAFLELVDSKYFASYWMAHNNLYGVSTSSIKEGLNIISISRAAVQDFEKAFEKVYTINVTLNKEALKQRLINRNRESLAQIERRLNRTYEKIDAKKLIEFENSKPLEESSKEFLDLLQRIQSDRF